MTTPAPTRLTKRDRVERNQILAQELQATFSEYAKVRKIFIDCSFGKIMDEVEQSSLALQIQQCYSHLRLYGGGRTQMFITSVDQRLRDRIQRRGGDQWVIHSHREDLEAVVDLVNATPDSDGMMSSVIIMSPDASEELSVDDLKRKDSIFVIGGIVDRSVSKNETAFKALRLGIQSRRLPVDSDKHINKVFNIDSVFQFLLQAFDNEGITCREDMINLISDILPDRKLRPVTKVKVEKAVAEVQAVHGVAKIVEDPCNTIKLDRYRVLELFR